MTLWARRGRLNAATAAREGTTKDHRLASSPASKLFTAFSAGWKAWMTGCLEFPAATAVRSPVLGHIVLFLVFRSIGKFSLKLTAARHVVGR